MFWTLSEHLKDMHRLGSVVIQVILLLVLQNFAFTQGSICTNTPCIVWSNATFIFTSEMPAVPGTSTAPMATLASFKVPGSVYSLDVDFKNDRVYWTNYKTNTPIYRAFLNGTGIEVIRSYKQSVVMSFLAVEWTSGLLYYSERKERRISVSYLNGSYAKVLHRDQVYSPRGLAVSPKKGYLFWADDGGSYYAPRIERSSLSGQNRTLILALTTTTSYIPLDIVLDETTYTLFWCDFNKGLFKSDYDGNNMETIHQLTGIRPFDLALSNGILFYSDWGSNTINTVNASLTNNANILQTFGVPGSARSYGMAVFGSSAQPEGTIDCTAAGCSELCFPEVDGAVCGCKTGYPLNADGTTCKQKLDKFLLFSDRIAKTINILSLDVDTPIHETLPISYANMSDPYAIHFDPVDWMVYWSDRSKDCIYRSKLDGENFEKVVCLSVPVVTGLALDVIGRKVYWVDYLLDAIEVSNLDGSSRMMLINDAYYPWSIEISNNKGYVFWSEVSTSRPAIKRSDMDGMNVRTIVSTNIYKPYALAVNHLNETVFWISYTYGRVESCSFDGSNRILYYTNTNLQIYGMATDGVYGYIGERATGSIIEINLLTRGISTIASGVSYPADVYVYSSSLVPNGTNPCGINNGQCTDICLPGSQGVSCFCQTGRYLLTDLKSCTEEVTNFMLLSDYWKEKLYKVNIDALNPALENIPIDLSTARGPSAVGYDPVDQKIVVTDVWNSKIIRDNFNGTAYEELVNKSISKPRGLVVDWRFGNIYWTDQALQTLSVISKDGFYRLTLIGTGLTSPVGLAGDLKQSILFFSEEASPTRISRVFMDGTNRRVLAEIDGARINYMAVDPTVQRLYWVDEGLDIIECMDYDGQNRATVYSCADSGTNYRIVSIGTGVGHIFWGDDNTNKVYRTNISGTDLSTAVTEEYLHNLPRVLGIWVHEEAMYQNVSASPCDLNKGGCEHLCLPANDSTGFVCACKDANVLDTNGKSCVDAKPEEVMFASDYWNEELYWIHLTKHTRQVLPIDMTGSRGPSGIAYDYCNNRIFWTDVYNDKIIRSYLNGTGKMEVINTDIQSPYSIGLDCEIGNMYWTDYGRHTIEVSRLDGTNRRVLIHIDIDAPYGLVLAAQDGIMFWTERDGTSVARIACAKMDGTDQKVIIDSPDYISRPNAIALDVKAKKIYWTDSTLDVISRADYDGQNVQIVIRSTDHIVRAPYGVDIAFDKIYWTDIYHEKIYQANLTDFVQTDLITGIPYSLGIHVYEKAKYENIDNPCGDNHGGCSFLCLRIPNGSRCACPLGHVLKDDLTSCERVEGLGEAFMLVPQRGYITTISLKPYVDFVVTNLFGGSFVPTAVDYDPVENMVYFTDLHQLAISRAYVNGTGLEVLLHVDVHKPIGIAVDWVQRNLFFTDDSTNRIEMSALDGRNRRVLIDTDLDEPNTIIVYPAKGLMFWNDWGVAGKVERADMDGSNRQVLANTTGWPHGLAIDMAKDTLYFFDSYFGKIEQMGIDGTNRKVIHDTISGFGVGLGYYSGWLYWSDKITRSVQRLSLLDVNATHHVIARGFSLPLGLTIVDPAFKKEETNPCGTDNGGCSHLCVAIPTGVTCLCPTAVEMNDDKKTCDMATFMTEFKKSFFLYSDRDMKAIIAVSLSVPEYPTITLPFDAQYLDSPRGIAYNPDGETVFWFDSTYGHIASSSMDGSNAKVIATGISHVYGLALDWKSGLLYWADYNKKIIEVSKMDGTYRRTLYSNLRNPRAIALDVIKGEMYIGDDNKILINSMDGSSTKMFLQLGSVYDSAVTALSLNLVKRKLISADTIGNQIEEIDLDTKSKDLLKDVSQSNGYIFGMAYCDKKIFWVDTSTNSVHMMILANKSDVIVATGVDRGYDVEAFCTDSYPKGDTACTDTNGLCSDLCLPSPTGKTCFCDTGASLKADALTCNDSCSRLAIAWGSVSYTSLKFNGVATLTCNSGYTGSTTKTCQNSGDWSTEDFTCTDTEKPVITCPSDITQDNDVGKGTAVVSWTDPVPTDNSGGNLTLTSNKTPGDSFTIGSNTVTYTVTDPTGLTAKCNFTITIKDVENPVVTCPSNIDQGTDLHKSTATVTTDNSGGSLTVLLSLEESLNVVFNEVNITDNSKSTNIEMLINSVKQDGVLTSKMLNWGIHEIEYKATDANGNSANCTYSIYIASTSCDLIQNNGLDNVLCETQVNTFKKCTVECPQGESVSSDAFYCSSDPSVWQNADSEQLQENALIPSCSKINDEVKISTKVEQVYISEDCSQGTIDQIAEGFNEIFEQNVAPAISNCDNDACSTTSSATCDSQRRRATEHDITATVIFVANVPKDAIKNITGFSDDIVNKLNTALRSTSLDVKVDGEVIKPKGKPAITSGLIICKDGYTYVPLVGCVACSRGYYHIKDSGKCATCTAGSYQSAEAQSSCIMCPSKKTKGDAMKSESSSMCVPVKEEKAKTGLIIGLIVFFVVLLLLIFSGILFWRYRTTGNFPLLQRTKSVSRPTNPLVLTEMKPNIDDCNL